MASAEQGGAGLAPRARAWLLAAAALVVVAVVVAVVLATRGPAEPPISAPSSDGQSTGTAQASVTEDGTATTGTATSDSPSAPPSQPATPPATPSGEPPVAPTDRPTDPPVAIEDEAQPAPGLNVRLSSIEAVEGIPKTSGDVGGPSLRVTVEITNSSDAPVNLSGAVVNLYIGADRRPALELSEPGGRAVPASVEPGATVSGVYIFNVPVADRAMVAVEVDVALELPVVVFEGSAPTA